MGRQIPHTAQLSETADFHHILGRTAKCDQLGLYDKAGFGFALKIFVRQLRIVRKIQLHLLLLQVSEILGRPLQKVSRPVIMRDSLALHASC